MNEPGNPIARVAAVTRAMRRSWLPDERGLGLWPYFNLLLLFYLFLLLLLHQQELSLLVPLSSALAMLMFLPIYFAGYLASGWKRVPVSLAVAGVGFALIPFNPSGFIFVICAIAQAIFFLRPRPALLLMAALLLIMGVEMVLVWQCWNDLAVTAGITVPAALGTLLARAAMRRHPELRLSQDEVRRLARARERERIGRDLHDLLGHTLSLVALKSELAGKLLDRDLRAAREQIREVEQVARDSLGQVRRAVAGILAAGLEAEVTRARLALLASEIELDARLDPIPLAPDAETALALGLRESITNILRHAGAGKVLVDLRREGAWALLEIEDDGRGGGCIRHGHGLSGMRDRLAALGGRLDVEAAPAGGTRLRMRLPLPAPPS
jgi:two-component system sensor histidine kinase DesK